MIFVINFKLTRYIVLDHTSRNIFTVIIISQATKRERFFIHGIIKDSDINLRDIVASVLHSSISFNGKDYHFK